MVDSSVRSFRQMSDGIDWYCEQRGAGPTIVLIPSGEGDCAAYDRVASHLADAFTILTFDMPGFSRSIAPDGYFGDGFGTRSLSGPIARLVESLDLGPATFFGSSSGGHAVLSLVADHPELVRNAVVHEVPLLQDDAWPDARAQSQAAMKALSDDEIPRVIGANFRDRLNQDPEAWDRLGDDYHARLAPNYVTWVRNYLGRLEHRVYTTEELRRRPIAWSLGGYSPVSSMFSNVRVSARLGQEPVILRSKHFPHVSIPEQLAEHIRTYTVEHL